MEVLAADSVGRLSGKEEATSIRIGSSPSTAYVKQFLTVRK